MFLQDGHNPPLMFFFSDVDGPVPSHDVTDMYATLIFGKIQCTLHMVFYAKHVSVFIDIHRLKGKRMQNLIKILVHYVVQEI